MRLTDDPLVRTLVDLAAMAIIGLGAAYRWVVDLLVSPGWLFWIFMLLLWLVTRVDALHAAREAAEKRRRVEVVELRDLLRELHDALCTERGICEGRYRGLIDGLREIYATVEKTYDKAYDIDARQQLDALNGHRQLEELQTMVTQVQEVAHRLQDDVQDCHYQLKALDRRLTR